MTPGDVAQVAREIAWCRAFTLMDGMLVRVGCGALAGMELRVGDVLAYGLDPQDCLPIVEDPNTLWCLVAQGYKAAYDAATLCQGRGLGEVAESLWQAWTDLCDAVRVPGAGPEAVLPHVLRIFLLHDKVFRDNPR